MRFGRRKVAPPPGDDDRFTADLLAWLDALYGSALRLTRNPDTAQDLVQDTCLRALRSRGQFTPGTNLKAWLYTILHNTWRNQRRDRMRTRVDADSEVVEAAAERAVEGWAPQAESPESLLLRETLNDDLRLAIEALPEAYREAVWLRDVDELSYQEIATILDVPVGTVMSRLSRGRRQLYRALTSAGRNPRPAPAS